MKHPSDFSDRQTNGLPWYKKKFIEVRTQILLCYLGLLAILMGISIPTVHNVIFQRIDSRLRAEIASEIAEFESDFDLKKNQNLSQVKQSAIAYLRNDLVEKEQYFIILLEDNFFQSIPVIYDLPQSLQPNSQLIERLISQKETVSGEFQTQELEVGKIIYRTFLFDTPGQDKGVFLVARATYSEYKEAALAMRLIVIVTTTLFLLTSIGAWFISDWILKPLRLMSATAKQISEKDLSQRLSILGQGEMAQVASTFNAMMERLEKAFQTQKSFVRNASHELKTPITIIQGHLDLMGEDPEEQHETQAIINEQLDRMTRLVEDLLILTRVEQPEFLQPELIEIEVFTQKLFQKAKVFTEANLQLEKVGQGKLYIDPKRLTQAIMNLIENAVQHTPLGGKISIGSVCNESDVRFWVRDTGMGIAHSDRKQIFNPFARAAHSYRRSNGFGLGLSIAQAIVSACGGSIILDSLPGKGSTFTLIFPVKNSLVIYD
ncbi:Histidine kinase [Hyella patelloides LEGE 07179]|uniref:histidine kinase n=1 Tax=Hyella patelloides LEGE 07179 TaxID=945734 RepID=A0A563VKZ7_9CYAN|nr:HAMP domain-containing sensor histidine kinase [Hyella patelloides]VEP12003.1 Histidine kinase [Hyella patelloides LEGE 07179]